MTPKFKPVYSHIRDFAGIIDTIYGSTSAAPHYVSYDLGKHASHYLQAHGYTEATISEIERLWTASKTVDDFTDHLVPLGMAVTEVTWLWDLIHHDDDCGF